MIKKNIFVTNGLTPSFKYEWRLVSNNALGTEVDQHSDTLKLSGLAEGVYLFKVVVTASSPPGWVSFPWIRYLSTKIVLSKTFLTEESCGMIEE